MEELETVHPDYQKGFNEGYLMAELDPEIGKILSQVKGSSERIEGFKDGHAQFLLEKDKALLPDWLKERKVTTDKTNDKDKGREEIDRE